MRHGFVQSSFGPTVSLNSSIAHRFDDGGGDGALYFAARNPEISVNAVSHFAMGIFWKASIHSWKGGKDTPLIELEEGDEVRRWLRGESTFPHTLALTITVSRPERAQPTFNSPGEIREGRLRAYQFHALGINFGLHADAETSVKTRMMCFYQNLDHPLVVSDGVTRTIELKQAQHFAESRKTRAYERSKAKRCK